MARDQDATTQVLHYDGADLAYETSGEGPPLLILAAGMDHSAVAAPLAAHLANHFTTIRFDRRGVSRGARTAHAAAADQLAAHADDAAALVDSITDDPVFVFGASIGALVGFELIGRHPASVRHAVLHEPPAESLVPDPTRSAKLDAVGKLAVDDPVGAVGGFAEIVGSGDVREPDAPEHPQMDDPVLTLQNFFRSDFEAVRRYKPDEAALHAAAERLTLTQGAYSVGRFEALCSTALGARLGLPVTTIQSGHNPVADFPRSLATFLISHLLGPAPASPDSHR